jgi:hypothetical protein
VRVVRALGIGVGGLRTGEVEVQGGDDTGVSGGVDLHRVGVNIDPLGASGTVRFLFTDIEGSTRLWSQDR